MSSKGFIIIQRDFFETNLWEENRTFSRAEAFIDLVTMKRFEAKYEFIIHKRIEVNKHDIPVSLRFLAKRWNWSKNKVADFIKNLVARQVLGQRTVQGQTIITVLKYGVLEDVGDKKRTHLGTQKGQQRDSEGTNIKKDNKVNNLIIKEKEKGKRKNFIFSPPQLFEIEELFLTKLDFDLAKNESERFFNYYQSNGWVVGRSKMKSWHHAALNWLNRFKDFEKEKEKSFEKKEKDNGNQRMYGRNTEQVTINNATGW